MAAKFKAPSAKENNARKKVHKQREAWLWAAFDNGIKQMFPRGTQFPKMRFSTGFPSKRALSPTKRRMGEAWSPSASADGHAHLIMSEAIADPIEMLSILMHEIVHAVAGNECGHRGPFIDLAKYIGLKRPWTSTTPTPECVEALKDVMKVIGRMPHAPIIASELAKKKQKTYMLKIFCEECDDEGEPYVARMAQVQIDRGTPMCPEHGTPMVVAE